MKKTMLLPLVFLLALTCPSLAADLYDLPVGLIVTEGRQTSHQGGALSAITLALTQQHREQTPIQFNVSADRISTVDAYKLSKLICRQFDRGVVALMGVVDPESFDTLHSYANAFEMPFVTPWFPETAFGLSADFDVGGKVNAPSASSSSSAATGEKAPGFAMQIRPDYHEAIIDIVTYYGWHKVIYIYSDFDGLLRLQNIYRSIPRDSRGFYQFNVEMVRKVSSASDALQFLLDLERINRHSLKRIILDCSDKIAKELIVNHVNNIELGRRNYHYLLSNLVLEDAWATSVPEYGAINVTGLRLFDAERNDASRAFLRRWRKEVGEGRALPAVAVLAHDAVSVMEAAFASLLTQKPNLFRPPQGGANGKFSRKGPLMCDMSLDPEKKRSWESGGAIARALRAVNLPNGLSGPIRFDEDGRRVDFALDVMEMTPDSQLVRVGQWGDQRGLEMDSQTFPHRGYLPKSRNFNNRTYVMTTIIEEPYMMVRRNPDGSERYEGYCKDLADLISKETGISFQIRPVKDGKYGIPDSNAQGGWNGMIGELVRREAEIAIAPLTINSAREKVADFTKPFMSLGISIMIKKPVKKRPGVFSFMSPLSMEIWGCVAFAYVGVSIVLFLVSRFSPHEWKIEGNLSGTTVANAFSVANSLWFSLGSLMQQGTDMTPRSLSGRVVGGAWWFFSLILISSYTANLAAHLTVERMVTPIKSADELSQQTEIEYGALKGGTTLAFFKNSKISVYARMWDFMSARPYVLTNTTKEGIERVRKSKGKYAFLIESTTNEYINERLPCNTWKVGKNLDAKGYGIATGKGSGLHEPINLAVLKLKENGDLAKLKNKWWYENTECSENESAKSNMRNELLLSNVAGIFFILVGGLIVAMFAALFEFCYNSKKEARRAKTTLSEAMRNKARLALSGGRDLDAVRFYGAGDSSAL